MELELCKEFTFEASHILPKHKGKCSRLHGHSWKLRVYVKGSVNGDTGFVMDYSDLKAIVQPIVDELDHRHLGSWPYAHGEIFLGFEGDFNIWGVAGLPDNFYPSSENLIIWIGIEIDKAYKAHFWSRLELDETCTSRCILTREEYAKQTR